MKYNLYKNQILIVPELDKEQISALIVIAPQTVSHYAKNGTTYKGVWTIERSIEESKEKLLKKEWDEITAKLRRRL